MKTRSEPHTDNGHYAQHNIAKGTEGNEQPNMTHISNHKQKHKQSEKKTPTSVTNNEIIRSIKSKSQTNKIQLLKMLAFVCIQPQTHIMIITISSRFYHVHASGSPHLIFTLGGKGEGTKGELHFTHRCSEECL